MIRKMIPLLVASILLVSFYIERSLPDGQWPVTGGSKANTRYSSLAQVDTNNVQQLQVAWVYHSEKGDSTKFGPMECNPLIVEGRLYGVSSRMKLFSIDAATGRRQWQFDPADSATSPGWRLNSVNMNRGVAYWADGDDKRIIYTVGYVVFEVNAITGQPVASFGRNGGIDLRYGLGRRDPAKLNVAPTSPVMVFKDLFFVSGLVGDNTPGHIRAFDVRTGRQKWIFHTIPYPGEPGYNTWKNKEAYKYMGSTNCWAGFSLDEKRGILFAVTGNPSNDFYGGVRLGSGLYGNCIIALDAATGKKIWHYQLVHHDVWDRDLPTPPALVTLTYKGRQVDAVVQTTKQGLIFVLDRTTGQPIFPVKETPFPTNTALKGEELWPTQPIPVMPRPFARQTLTEDDLNTLVSDSSYADIKRRFRSYRKGSIFTPPSKEGTIIFPGYDGGGEWGGPAVDPATNILYVNANEMAWVLTMVDNKIKPQAGQTNGQAGQGIYMQNCRSCHGPGREGGGDIPSLIGIGKKYTRSKLLELIAGGRRMMPSFHQFTSAQKDALASFILNNRIEQQKEYKGPAAKTKSSQPQDLYGSTGYNKFLTREGYPVISPPWGTLSAIDLNTCDFVWQIPFGEFPELKQKGIPTTGRENYGGPVVTAGGLLFIGATADGKFRAINKRTGQVLWETDLPAPGVATPAVYSLNGKQYIVIACGGSKWGGQHSDAYVAFTLPPGDAVRTSGTGHAAGSTWWNACTRWRGIFWNCM
jgi:quinoprotein glucose dehydrogenase